MFKSMVRFVALFGLLAYGIIAVAEEQIIVTPAQK